VLNEIQKRLPVTTDNLLIMEISFEQSILKLTNTLRSI
jgi:hypothetical protein